MFSSKKLEDAFPQAASRLGKELKKDASDLSTDWPEVGQVLERALTEDWEIKNLPEPFTGRGKGQLAHDFNDDELWFYLTALIGHGVAEKYNGEWLEQSNPTGVWLIGIHDARSPQKRKKQPVVKVRVQQIAADLLEEGTADVLDIPGLFSALDAEIQARLSDGGTAEEDETQEYNWIDQLDQVDLHSVEARVEEQSEAFRSFWKTKTKQNLLYDLKDGVEQIHTWCLTQRYLYPMNEESIQQVAAFAGQSALRYWSTQRFPNYSLDWQWLESHREVGIVISNESPSSEDDADNPDQQSEVTPVVFFPKDELLNFLETSEFPKSLVQVIEEFPEVVEQHFDPYKIPTNKFSTDDLEEAIDQAEGAGRDQKIPLEVWKLGPRMSLSSAVFEMRRQNLASSSGSPGDLLVPCQANLADGAMPVGVVPIEGLFFDNEDEIAEMVESAISQIEKELAVNKIQASLYVFFIHTGSELGDLVLLLEPSQLVGGSRKINYFTWNADHPLVKPRGPLDEEARKRLRLVDPITVRVRQALFHLRHTGDATRSRELLEEALELNENHVTALMTMCSLHLAIGNQITARGYIQRILKVEPDNFEARVLDARFLLEEGQTEEARVSVTELLEKSPDHADLYLVRARIHASDGNLDWAIEDVEKSRSLDPTNQEAEMLLEILSQEYTIS
jgi:tetratricopeptide (TPR) repeat protein